MHHGTVHATGPSLRVVIAFDSFKGCLDSRTAGEAARRGVLAAAPGARVDVVEVADGGEGTAAALLHACGGREAVAPSVDALGRPISASYVVLDPPDRPTVVIEAARTIDLDRAGPIDSTTPLRASSYGLGRQLRQALDSGSRRILVTLGGTAVTDGGTGLLLALGARLRDRDGADIEGGGNPIWRFDTLAPGSLPRLDGVEVTVMVDVDNPLLGARGAAAVFAPQKGATPVQVAELEAHLTHWSRALSEAAGRDVAVVPGAGAAGGCGAALVAIGARLEPGFARLAAEIGLADLIAGADLVLTGEGSVDAQTAMGKGPAGVARLAREAGVAVVALGGRVAEGCAELDALFDGVFCIHAEPREPGLALDPGLSARGLTATAASVTRLFEAARGDSP